MKDTTVKLSGHSKDRFLERFFAAETGLEPATRQRLLEKSRTTFTSLRVRKAALSPQRHAVAPMKAAVEAPSPRAAPKAPVSSGPVPQAPTAQAAPAAAEPAFDPYGIGLVPVFQREGRDGLIAKLAAVTRLEQLRAMAKAQQIVLPQELRSGEATLDAVRQGIADAVAKRIADRRAAAG